MKKVKIRNKNNILYLLLGLALLNFAGCGKTIDSVSREEQKKRDTEIEAIVSNTAKYGNDEIKDSIKRYLYENNISCKEVTVDDYDKFTKDIYIISNFLSYKRSYIKLNKVSDIESDIMSELILSYTGNDDIDSKNMTTAIEKLMDKKNMIEKLEVVKVNSSLNTLLIVTDYNSYKFKIHNK